MNHIGQGLSVFFLILRHSFNKDFYSGQNDTHISIMTVICRSVSSKSMLITDSPSVLSNDVKSWRTKIRGSYWLCQPTHYVSQVSEFSEEEDLKKLPRP